MRTQAHIVVCGGAAAAMLVAGPASAQHAKPQGPLAQTAAEPYGLQTFGMFRELILSGDFGPKVVLGSAMSRSPSTGVGAVSGARGEITIVDGKLIVSYGKPAAHPAADAETAALLATARVREWQTITVHSDIAPVAIEAFLAEAAKANGLDPGKSFPFQLRGTFAPYAMHVNAGPTGGPHGMGLPMAITQETKGDHIAGGVAGVFASPSLVGIATHGGQRTHAHWVSSDGKATAHLDLWGIKAGATLMLPKPE